MIRTTVGVLTVLTVVAIFGGCVGFGKVVLDNPTANGSLDQSYLFSPNHRVTHVHLALPEADLAIEGDRDSTSVLVGPLLPFIPWPPGIATLLFKEEGEPDQPLRIHMRLAPKDRSLNINAQKMVLLLEDGRQLVPARVKGPSPLETKKVVGVEKLFYVCTGMDYERTMGFEETITGPVCLTLEYGISAVPNKSFTLLIKGLSASSQMIEVSPIRFDKHSHYDIYMFTSR